MATLPKLRKLNISDTGLEVEGFVEASACRIGRNENEKTPLWWAANCGQAHTARRLLEVTADRRGVEVDMAETDCGNTPLVQAASQGFAEVAKVLLQHRADVNKLRNDGFTPLHFAAQVGSAEVAQVLLEHRVDVHKANKNMSTPLHQSPPLTWVCRRMRTHAWKGVQECRRAVPKFFPGVLNSWVP